MSSVKSTDGTINQRRHLEYIDYSHLKDLEQPRPHNGRKIRPDDPIRGILDRYRGISDEGAAAAARDINQFLAAPKPKEISQNVVNTSRALAEYAPYATYRDDMKTLDGMKFELLGNAVSNVDRSFVNPSSTDDLSKLSAEQKAAMLYDLIKIKQEFTAYADQYGDAVPNIDRAQEAIDMRIDRLSNDPDTQNFISEAVTKGLQEFLLRPENADLSMRLQLAFITDIAGGNAIERSLGEGKSFEDALKDYYQELHDLTQILPPSMTENLLDTADASLSQAIQDHYLSDGNPGDLGIFQTDASGKSATIDPVAQIAATSFITSQISNSAVNLTSLKQNFAQDVTRNVDGVIRLMRSGLKLDDAIATLRKSQGEKSVPAGVDAEAYKAGLFHAVQMISMSAVLVSRSIGVGGKWQPADIAAAVASGMQIVGMATEGMAKNIGVAGKSFSLFGTTNGSWGRAITNMFDAANIEAGGKILGSMGGLAMAGLTFFSAHRSLKNGDDAQAALEIIAGTAGTANALIGFAEAGLQLTSALGSALRTPISAEFWIIARNALKTGLSIAGAATAVITTVAGMVLGFLDIARGLKQLGDREKSLNPKLEKYTGETVRLEFGVNPL